MDKILFNYGVSILRLRRRPRVRCVEKMISYFKAFFEVDKYTDRGDASFDTLISDSRSEWRQKKADVQLIPQKIDTQNNSGVSVKVSKIKPPFTVCIADKSTEMRG